MEVDTTGIMGQSQALQKIFSLLAKAAPTESSVLITGEPGTGKHLMANVLHRNSKRNHAPFTRVDCGAVSGERLPSELFGQATAPREDAPVLRTGHIERTEGGTLFLANIDRMDVDLQAAMMHFLQTGTFERVRGTRPHAANVRIIASADSDLANNVARGTFREDLFYRLSIIPLYLPPLRERPGDIPLLTDAFLRAACRDRHRPLLQLDPGATAGLAGYAWPGNVRELKQLMTSAALICPGDTITQGDLPMRIFQDTDIKTFIRSDIPDNAQGFSWPTIRDMQEQNLELKEFFDAMETRLLTEAMQISRGVKNQAAHILGIKRTTLIEKLKKKKIQ